MVRGTSGRLSRGSYFPTRPGAKWARAQLMRLSSWLQASPRRPKRPDPPEDAVPEQDCWLKQMDVWSRGFNTLYTECLYQCDGFEMPVHYVGAHQCEPRWYGNP